MMILISSSPPPQCNSLRAQCLKITKNVAFENFNFGIFHHFLAFLINFCPLICKRSSLRSQCWMRLFFDFSTLWSSRMENLLWILSVSQCHKVYDCEDFGMQAIFNWMQFLTTTQAQCLKIPKNVSFWNLAFFTNFRVLSY